MTILGLADAVVSPLIRALSPDDAELDRDALADRFARAAWSGIAEPGDRDAGHLVAALGAEAALAALAATPPPNGDEVDVRVLVAAIVSAGGDAVIGRGLDGEDLANAVRRWRPRVSSPTALLALRQAARFGASLLVPDDRDWPVGVDELGEHAPLALWARGDRALLGRLDRSMAIVGARAATGYGEHVTVEASAGLVDRGFTIVSGAAYGIDGIAHRAALASSGSTVAFLAGGVDRFYPAGHEALLTRIVERGVVVSEVPCGTAPTKWRFLQRNRLIAAASRATVVVEAGWRSGSLNTASHAATLGRPIGAVPGPITSAASAGCHRLLRDFTAVCVTGPDDMAELLPFEQNSPGHASSPPPASTRPVAPRADPTGTRVRLLDALSERSGRPVGVIVRLSGLAPDRVRAELGRLELEGLVHERAAGWLKFTAKQLEAARG
ncbi:MAG: DNA-protecting protein DprA [Acidobacteria bacterium]|nr:DNA-protecting protein DprA [Acidobacteriota bacterium]